jgi:hypothetical protein
MTKTQNYVIWLQGFLEACDDTPTKKQVTTIKNKLNDIFEHVADEPVKKLSIEELGKIHGFPVFNDGITNHGGILPDEDGVVMRC